MKNKKEKTVKALQELPDILTAEMIAAYLRISYVKGLALIKYSGLKHIKIGNTYRVNKNTFQKWLADSEKTNKIHVS